jgi:hypothetical protein
MKQVLRITLLALVASSFVTLGNAQITNFTVNGDTADGQSFVTGSVVTWQYNLPTGTSAECQLWYDINQNGAIDTAIDYNYFTFTQTDGDTNGHGGPPDQDGLVNGHILFSQSIGLAPGKYVFEVSQNSSVVIRKFTVTALASPVHTISGTVTPPAGKSALNVLIDLKQNSQGNDNSKFWDTFTDVNGHFTVGMDADTAGNPWQLRIGQNNTNPYPPYIGVPGEYDITVANAAYTGYNFTFEAAAAQVAGYLKDQNGNPLGGVNVYLSRGDSNNLNYNTNTDQVTGSFDFGIAGSDLDGATWNLAESTNGNMSEGNTSGYMQAYAPLGVISAGDSLFRNIISYTINSTITGQVMANGSPVHNALSLMATTAGDSGQSFTSVDSLTGNFSMPVSNKIYNYNIFVNNPGNGPGGQVNNVHPGQSGVIINLGSNGGVTADVVVNTNWNLISVPVQSVDQRKTTLFPSALSNAFAYLPGNGYALAETLSVGTGYWLKFAGPQTIPLSGYGPPTDTISVIAGWNLIGSAYSWVADSTIQVIPENISFNTPFQYGSLGYTKTDTLQAGQGYWIKVSGNGRIILTVPPGKMPAKNPPRGVLKSQPFKQK